MDDKNKKATCLNSIRGTQGFTKPSQTNDNANVQINTEIAIQKLKILAQDYIGVTDPYGFLTNLRNALDIPNLEGASKYGVENPLTQIVNSIIGFLLTGIYEDTTGIAFKNSSPI